MHATIRTFFVALCASTLAACASSPPSQLISARAAYQRAAEGPAGEIAPAELKYAEEALKRAERSFRDDGADSETRDLAYIAERRAEIAAAVAERRIAEQEKQQLETEFTEVSQRLREDTVKELKQTRDELGDKQDQVQRERQGRVEAEQERDQIEQEKQRLEIEAKLAREALARWAQLVENERGLVITLSSGVLFATGKSEVLPAASARLNAIAEFLRVTPERRIVIEGHTDNAGTDAANQVLSQARAFAVRDYLITQGVPSTRLEAVGFGESKPIATNETNEGRTTNRRVEIVLEKLPDAPMQQVPAPEPSKVK